MKETSNYGSLGMWPGVVLERRCLLLLGGMTTHALRKHTCETHAREAWKVLDVQEISIGRYDTMNGSFLSHAASPRW